MILSFDKTECLPLINDEAVTFTNCLRVNSEISHCIECVPSFYLNSDFKCQEFYDPKCQKFGPKGCEVCEDNALKVKWKTISSSIRQCKPDNLVTFTKVENCLSHDESGACLGCSTGYALNSDSLVCVELENCLIFDSRKNKCVSCFGGFFVHSSGSCQKGDLANCTKYINQNECLTCETGFLLKGFYTENGDLKYRRCIKEPLIGRSTLTTLIEFRFIKILF